jgi:hypothetical protein
MLKETVMAQVLCRLLSGAEENLNKYVRIEIRTGHLSKLEAFPLEPACSVTLKLLFKEGYSWPRHSSSG